MLVWLLSVLRWACGVLRIFELMFWCEVCWVSCFSCRAFIRVFRDPPSRSEDEATEYFVCDDR